MMPARASPASVGRSRPIPNFENVIAEADRNVEAALASLESPRDTRAPCTPTGRLTLLAAKHRWCHHSFWDCHWLPNRPEFALCVNASLFVDDFELAWFLIYQPIHHFFLSAFLPISVPFINQFTLVVLCWHVQWCWHCLLSDVCLSHPWDCRSLICQFDTLLQW